MLNASFVLVCVSQAIEEYNEIVTLNLKCCQPQGCQHPVSDMFGGSLSIFVSLEKCR